MNKRREKLKKWLEESSWEVGGDFGQHHTNSTKWIFWELIRNFKILFPRRFTLFACASETDNRINWFSFHKVNFLSFHFLTFNLILRFKRCSSLTSYDSCLFRIRKSNGSQSSQRTSIGTTRTSCSTSRSESSLHSLLNFGRVD